MDHRAFRPRFRLYKSVCPCLAKTYMIKIETDHGPEYVLKNYGTRVRYRTLVRVKIQMMKRRIDKNIKEVVEGNEWWLA